MTETWRPVLGFENLYEVSDHGRVRGLDRIRVQLNRWGELAPHRYRGKIKNQRLDRKGYPTLSLYCGGKGKHFLVHVLVAEAFLGPRPAGKEVCHNDGGRQNNVPTNLRWDTRAANLADRHLHGTDYQGKQNPRARLSEADVAAIRSTNASVMELAARFKVSPHHIVKIRRRDRWSHV